jgi:leucyl aminopeptidase
MPWCEDERLAPYKEIDSALGGLITKIISSGEFIGKRNQITLLHTANMVKPQKILLIGLGKRKNLTSETVRQAGGKAASYLSELGLKTTALSMEYICSLQYSPLSFVEGSLLSLYKFRKYRKDDNAKGIESLTLLGKPEKSLYDSLQWAETVTSAVRFARDLINTPANDMTPSVLAKVAKSLATGKVSVKILSRNDAEKEGMGAYLAVAKGSDEPPKFIVLDYGGSDGPPVVFIGKSITFDSGGISIKPGDGMEKMKYDMAGGAVVLALIKVASECDLPIHIVGLLPATENLPSGSASRPGDIVSTILGKTVEIINTDAEGRLVLADAIGFAKKMKPRAIIDIATLTGACSVALGNEASAMMGNDNRLMDRVKAIGDEIHERVWQMPLYEEYREYIKSDFADLKNTGGKTGSLVTAAYFLKEFAGDTPWVHLDIAGTAWTDKEMPYIPKGATGFGVRLLSNFVREIANENL